MNESNQYLVVVIVTVLMFLPLVIAKARQEPPYNPHSPYWKAKNRRRGR
jgi:hypothetical protein